MRIVSPNSYILSLFSFGGMLAGDAAVCGVFSAALSTCASAPELWLRVNFVTASMWHRGYTCFLGQHHIKRMRRCYRAKNFAARMNADTRAALFRSWLLQSSRLYREILLLLAWRKLISSNAPSHLAP